MSDRLSSQLRAARDALYYRQRIARVLTRDALRAPALQRRTPVDLASLSCWCSFLSMPRSGHSLVAALLEAHPDVVMGSEYGALDHVIWGFGPQAIAAILQEHSATLPFNRQSHGPKARLRGAMFNVDGQWQGRVRRLRVLGDRNGSADTDRIDRRPWLLPKVERCFGVPARLVHVFRNPFDVVTTIVHAGQTNGRGPRMISTAIDLVEARTASHLRIYRSVGDARIFPFCHEAHLATPQSVFGQLLTFLGLEAEQDYLDACAAICFAKPRSFFDASDWTPQELDRVSALIDRTSFLSCYPSDPHAPRV